MKAGEAEKLKRGNTELRKSLEAAESERDRYEVHQFPILFLKKICILFLISNTSIRYQKEWGDDGIEPELKRQVTEERLCNCFVAQKCGRKRYFCPCRWRPSALTSAALANRPPTSLGPWPMQTPQRRRSRSSPSLERGRRHLMMWRRRASGSSSSRKSFPMENGCEGVRPTFKIRNKKQGEGQLFRSFLHFPSCFYLALFTCRPSSSKS